MHQLNNNHLVVFNLQLLNNNNSVDSNPQLHNKTNNLVASNQPLHLSLHPLATIVLLEGW